MLGRLPLLSEVWFPQAHYEALRRLGSAVDQQRSDQRLDHVADDILALARSVLSRLLPQLNDRGHAELAADLGAGLARDEHIVAPRQIALRLIGVTVVKGASNDVAENPVAEKFQPLVIVLARACVGQGELEQPQVPRLMPQRLANELADIRLHSDSPV